MPFFVIFAGVPEITVCTVAVEPEPISKFVFIPLNSWKSAAAGKATLPFLTIRPERTRVPLPALTE
jgi:hypothetical protein